MRKLKIVLGAFLLFTLALTGMTSALAPTTPPGGGGNTKICGAWEPRGGAGDGFRRFCSKGSLYWYEYMD